ncbi:MAG: class IV adenylate cyclase [Egibacteraceae bacterium]
MKYIEVERKLQLDEPDALRAQLIHLDAKPSPGIRQVDTYYNAPHRDFLAPEVIFEWLRIRESDGAASINFKRWLPVDAQIKTHCEEFETAVEDVEAVRRMLRALDFTEMVTVDKVREEWTVGDDIVVAFDTVASAGSFVEFEFEGDAETIEDAIAQLDSFIESLGVDLGQRLNRGYPHMLLGRER